MLKRARRLLSRSKFRTKLFCGFLSVSLLPLVVLGILSYTIARDSLRDQMESRVADYVDRVSTQLNAVYRRTQEALDNVVYSDELLALLVALKNNQVRIGEVQLYMEDCLQRLQPVSASIQRLDVLLSGDTGLRYNDAALAALVEEALSLHEDSAAQLAAAGVYWFAAEEALYAVCTVPDLYRNQEAARLVMVMDKQSFFRESLMGENPDFGILVADSGGGSVISLVKNVMTTGVMPVSFLENASQNLVQYNGAQYLFGSAALEAGGWRLYILMSYEYAVQRTGNIVASTVAAMAAGVVLIALIAYLLSIGFTSRIDLLIRQMKQVSKGNWLIEPSADQRDEVGQLSRAFEGMVTQLESLIHDVYESKIAQRESEFKALQTQINPHFLYNCLDNMNWYAILRGDEHSSYVITQLSDYYRTSLNRGKNTITVADELKNAIAYMNLQLELHDNNFVFEKDIEEGLGGYITLNLMLQPLLENAVKHGVDKVRDKTADKRIRLTARLQGGALWFSVFNTGDSIRPEVLRSVFVEKTGGYGLRNVDERLRLLFGDDYGLRIEGVSGGTLCTIHIPLRAAPPDGGEEEPA